MDIQLSTERLELRPLAKDDWDLFLHLYTDEQLMTYIGDPIDESLLRERFFERLKPWDTTKKHWFSLVIVEKDTGRAVGLCGLRIQWEDGQRAEIGYMLLEDVQGKGYATEALEAVLQFVHGTLGFHKITAMTAVDNSASRRVLEKAGFELEGMRWRDVMIAGEWVDSCVYARSG